MLSVPHTRSPRVLLIDDDRVSHEVVAAHLAREGYELSFAEDGTSGLDLAQTSHPDTILLDVMMPGVDGFEVCRRLRASPTLAHIPVILLTALDDRRYVAEGIGAGADEFVSKPVVGSELRARVRSMLRIKRQHDELRRLLQLREDLVQMAVHDIRSPLNVILTFAELLVQDGALTTSQSNDLAELVHGAERVDQLVNELLMLAKLEEGELRLRTTRLDLASLLRQTVEVHRRTSQRRRLTLALDAPASAELSGDVSLLSRVLDNLMTNAAKFSPPGGKVEITLRADDGVVVRFADQGPGIPPEHRDKIFDKFGIVELRQQNVPQCGLGLAFCKLAVEAHGGSIEIADNAPRGAVFTLRLPAGSPPEQP